MLKLHKCSGHGENVLQAEEGSENSKVMVTLKIQRSNMRLVYLVPTVFGHALQICTCAGHSSLCNVKDSGS